MRNAADHTRTSAVNKVVSAAGETYVISAKAGGVNYVEGKVLGKLTSYDKSRRIFSELWMPIYK